MRPTLAPVDLALIGLYVLFAIALGSSFTRKASKSIESFFVGDRKLPWWIAGTSIVATTFAADTPLAVTGIVASDGVSGNWIWWCFAIAHLVATFFFARMWRRSGVITDAELTELRYSGRPAAVLRGVKAVYAGLLINCLTMAWVIAAMVKISRAFFDVEPAWVIAACVGASVTYTLLGGFRSVVITDLVQFTLGMAGAILLAVLLVQQMGGIGAPGRPATPEEPAVAGYGLLGALSTSVEEAADRTLDDVLDFFPPRDHPTLPPIYMLVLLTAGWWRYAEGTGYIVQRLAACKTPAHAQGASLWFAVAHNALRPWPWLLVGLAALVVYPRLPGAPEAQLAATTAAGDHVTVAPARLDVATGGALRFEGLPADCRAATIQGAEVPLTDSAAAFEGFPDTGHFDLTVRCASGDLTFANLRVELLDREMAYPLLMGRTLPTGLLGLVVASLLAAFMSTVDTHTNWGASYLTQDLYKRFLVKDADPRHYVTVSRLFIVLMGILAGLAATVVHDIASVWRFLLTVGAGLGSVTAVRWYWPRVTPHAEFAAIGVTTLLAGGLELFGTPTLFGGDNPFFVLEVAAWQKILLTAGCSLAAWVATALLGPRNDEATLREFAARVRPPGPAWRPYRQAEPEPLRRAVLRFAAGLVVVFGVLFGIGELIVGKALVGIAALVLCAVLLPTIVAGRPEAGDEPSR